MVPLYALVVTALAGLKGLLARRAGRLERKYTRAALAAEQAAKQAHTKPGNAGSAGALAHAKHQYELGRLVQHRDVLEAKYLAWQGRADRLAHRLARLRGWNGRLVPYLCGVIDVALVLTALHHLGLPHGLTETQVREWAQALAK